MAGRHRLCYHITSFAASTAFVGVIDLITNKVSDVILISQHLHLLDLDARAVRTSIIRPCTFMIDNNTGLYDVITSIDDK